MIFSWQLVNILFKVAYFSPGREEELVRGEASGTAICEWVECDFPRPQPVHLFRCVASGVEWGHEIM